MFTNNLQILIHGLTLWGWLGSVVAVGVEPPAGASDTKPMPPASPDVVARVNGVGITLAELDAAVQAQLPAIPLSERDLAHFRTAVLEDLIDDVLLNQFLDKQDIQVGPAELQLQEAAFLAHLRRDGLTLEEYLRSTGQSRERLQAAWRLTARWQAYVRKVLTDQQLRKYYQEHPEQFDPARIRVRHILFRLDPDASPAQKQALRKRLELLREQIANGQIRMEVAARRYSHCPSGLHGGDMGWIARRQVAADDQWLEVAFRLPVQELSPVIESPLGLHLLRVEERQSAPLPRFEECRLEVLDAAGEKLRQELLRRLRREAVIDKPLREKHLPSVINQQ